VKKIRIDQLLVDKGLAPSRTRAQAMVMAGQVWSGEQRVQKPSQLLAPDGPLSVRGPDHPFVGRGGVKLREALDRFAVDPRNRVCLDIGASTGGFTDCLLQAGAKKVYAFDVGTHQFHERLRHDPRVVLQENFNARYLQPGDLPEPLDLVVVDVSFISLKLILPPLARSLPTPWEGLILVKPQFEAAPREVAKGGVVKDPEVRERVGREIRDFAEELGLNPSEPLPCSLQGESGNQEYFILLRHQGYKS
jgi:23S rRNA (cytidine1920-2'-O)/16S rRNA (cytidine1409-2'-O)-methyltransferase